MAKKISTSALAKLCDVQLKDMNQRLLDLNLIEEKNGTKALTAKGFAVGGEYQESDKYGKYIIWPEDIDLRPTNKEVTKDGNGTTPKPKLISSSNIGDTFDLSAQIVNNVLSELGWIKKGLKGWCIAEQGRKLNGVELTHSTSGVPYVKWPETIFDSKALNETISQFKGTEHKQKPAEDKGQIDFREKFEAKLRTTDGHFVRSKAEMLIDNWLYMAEIVHAYERKLPIEEDVYSDFYIPTGKVYIEYWGYEEDKKYLDRKQTKIEIYKKYGFNLIEIGDKEVQNLDDHLPRLLLKFGITSY